MKRERELFMKRKDYQKKLDALYDLALKEGDVRLALDILMVIQTLD